MPSYYGRERTDIMKADVWKMIFCVLFLIGESGMSGCQNNKTEIMLEEQESADITDAEEDTEQPAETEEVLMDDKSSEVSEMAEPADIFVDVCGAVLNPGVYEVRADSRIFQVIDAAGGFLPEAAASAVNQAQPVSDGQQIYVPTQEEVEEGTIPVQVQQAEPDGTADTTGSVVNINTADAAALQSLSGIGEAKAQAIIGYREEHGSFSSIEEIMQVPGIKENTFSAIKDKIAVK